MTPEEIEVLREENHTLKALVAELLPLREHLAQRDELIAQLQQRVQALESHEAKDSHNVAVESRGNHKPPLKERRSLTIS